MFRKFVDAFSIWLQLWRQAGALREAGIPALPEPPFNGRSAKASLRAISLRVPLPLFRRCRMRLRFPS